MTDGLRERGARVLESGRACRSLACVLLAVLASSAAAQPSLENLLDLSIEELGEIRVRTAWRRAEPVSRVPAAVHVITAEDIRRSGVTSLAEALRLAPGVEVARNGSSSWTISMRGFNSDLSNKLLVLIDGRSVYSPLYAGVFWDAQDVLLADIERIEVIGGPGGTLWGSNAVNGVINIVTYGARERQGGLVELGGGNEEEAFAAFRYGAQTGENVHARAYVKSFERDSTERLDGSDGVDDWRMRQGGFRMSWDASPDVLFTLRGDVYSGEQRSLVRGDFTLGTLPGPDRPGEIDVSGHNVVAQWLKRLDGDAEWRLQLYYDHTERDIPGTYREKRDTFDLDFQRHLRPLGRHDLLWGVTARSSSDDIESTTFAAFEPPSRSDQTYGAFLQDRIALTDELELTVGTKLERNDYSGTEHQPSVRLAWAFTQTQLLWAAASRAVRIPARLNEDLVLTAPVALPNMPPVYIRVAGSEDFEAEELEAYELGYRARVGERLSFDVALFRHDYDKLFSQEPLGVTAVPGPPAYIVLDAVQANLIEGEATGGTFVATWQPLGRLRFQLQYSRLDLDLGLKPGGHDEGRLGIAGNSPETQAALYTNLVLPLDLNLHVGVRHVDELPNLGVPSYDAVDLSLSWEPSERLRASLTVMNANDACHLEFGDGHYIERSALVRVVWTF